MTNVYTKNGSLTTEEKRARATESCRRWRAKNPDYYKIYYQKNKEQYAKTNRRYYDKNTEKRKQNTRHWEMRNPDKVKEYRAKRYADNREKVNACCRDWHSKNKIMIKERRKKWYIDNRHKVRAAWAKRRATKLNATPKWLTREQFLEIDRIYKSAIEQCLTVDHIVPLQGKNVCGLHVPWNMQLMSFEDNVRKHNRFTV